jgi:hypothetical protein
MGNLFKYIRVIKRFYQVFDKLCAVLLSFLIRLNKALRRNFTDLHDK